MGLGDIDGMTVMDGGRGREYEWGWEMWHIFWKKNGVGLEIGEGTIPFTYYDQAISMKILDNES